MMINVGCVHWYNNFIMDSTLNPSLLEPKKEEWALINKQQAYEYQRMKEIEKMVSKERK